MILPIVAIGTPILRIKCNPVENTPETQQHINNIIETLGQIPTGVGLAAPQCNIPLQMFITKANGIEKVIINPVIRKRRMEQRSEEGCLSIPGIFETVPNRPEIIDVTYYDERFNRQSMKLRGFDAVVFCHEYDHLHGILFVDYLTKEGKEKIQSQLNEIENGKIQTYYPMLFKEGVTQTNFGCTAKQDEDKSTEIIANKFNRNVFENPPFIFHANPERL